MSAAGDTVVNQTDENLCLHNLNSGEEARLQNGEKKKVEYT